MRKILNNSISFDTINKLCYNTHSKGRGFMARLIIEPNKGVAFADYLKLCMLQELDIRDNIASHFNNLPKYYMDYKQKK